MIEMMMKAATQQQSNINHHKVAWNPQSKELQSQESLHHPGQESQRYVLQDWIGMSEQKKHPEGLELGQLYTIKNPKLVGLTKDWMTRSKLLGAFD